MFDKDVVSAVVLGFLKFIKFGLFALFKFLSFCTIPCAKFFVFLSPGLVSRLASCLFGSAFCLGLPLLNFRLCRSLPFLLYLRQDRLSHVGVCMDESALRLRIAASAHEQNRHKGNQYAAKRDLSVFRLCPKFSKGGLVRSCVLFRQSLCSQANGHLAQFTKRGNFRANRRKPFLRLFKYRFHLRCPFFTRVNSVSATLRFRRAFRR